MTDYNNMIKNVINYFDGRRIKIKSKTEDFLILVVVIESFETKFCVVKRKEEPTYDIHNIFIFKTDTWEIVEKRLDKQFKNEIAPSCYICLKDYNLTCAETKLCCPVCINTICMGCFIKILRIEKRNIKCPVCRQKTLLADTSFFENYGDDKVEIFIKLYCKAHNINYENYEVKHKNIFVVV